MNKTMVSKPRGNFLELNPPVVLRLLTLLVCLLVLPIVGRAQAPYFEPSARNFTPLAEQPGAPVGSYPLSGFDNVNLFNGHMNFHLPLMQVGGRGKAGYTMMLPIEQHWQVKTVAVPTCDWSGCTYYESNYRYITNPIWWDGIRPAFSPGVLQGRQGGIWPGNWAQGCSGAIYYKTLTRLTFSAPDGTEYELRDKQTGGQPVMGGGCYGGPSRGKVFVTADGSAMTFISDADIYDDRQPREPNVIYPSGYLLFRDGMRYRIDSGKVSWIQDTNGNRVTFTYSGNNLVSIDDSLNRHITISGGSISFKGANGATRTLTVYSAPLSTALRKYPDGSTEYTIKTFAQLFSVPNPQQGTFDIPVTTAVQLPDGRQYQFRYDSYANLAQVILPTGGRIDYDWQTSTYQFGDHVYGIYTQMRERRTALNTTTSSYETRTNYSVGAGANNTTIAIVDMRDPKNGNTLISRTRHYFNGYWLAAPDSSNPYPGWADGREYQTELFAADGMTVLRRVNNTWRQRAAVGWYTGNANYEPPNDPRLVESITTLLDTNQVSKTTSIDPNNPTGPVGFDQYNNQTKVWEYDFGSGAPGPLLKQTVTSYLTSDYDTLLPNSTAPNVSLTTHIRNLPSQMSVYDAGGVERARATVEYDNYLTDTFHAALLDRTSISGHDLAVSTAYTKRGNPTAVSKYLLPAGTAITTHSQFDIAGNALKVIDPRSTAGNIISTTVAYEDNFGIPDGTVGERYVWPELGSLQTFAFPTQVTNALNQPAYTQYDYYLAQAINTQDLNGVVTAGYHNDLLDRLTQIRRGYGSSAENQTTYEYDDVNHTIYTKSDLTLFNDKTLVSSTIYDGLGRRIESRTYEGVSSFISIQSQYDGAGRLNKASNPFRAGEAVVWTTQAFDALGRQISTTTPDNAAVTTTYLGNTVTVTDQAGKVRKSVMDGLQRLIQVYEDPTGLNYQTTYLYDALDNLVKVTQGSQQRFFMYDSMKRLIRARNPEQATLASLNLSDPITGISTWSLAFQYDVNGNLTQKTDPRGVVITNVFDALNRNTTTDYSDTATINPDVSRFYDGAINGKGRFWYFYANGNFSSGSNVEHTAVDSYDALGRPLVQRQLFKTNGVWGQTYQTLRSYNRAGGILSQTYPSGHTIAYSYDVAGRTYSFSGNLGDGTSRTYSTGISYSSFGGLSWEQFGTNTLLYHKSFYNIRGQLFDTRLSSVNDMWDWNRGRLINYYSSNHIWGQSGTDNNGNVRFAETWIPPANATLDQADTLTEDSFSYDGVDRLTYVAEQRTSVAGGWGNWQQQFRQQFTYDPYGNRTIDAAQTWGTGINNKQFAVDAGTNRLGVPVGQSGVMSYDSAGNLTTDTYSGTGNRTYDANNRMTTAADNTGQVSRYSYDGNGRRTRRQIASGQEEWEIYGIDGELLADYRANASPSAPEKEYGYRNGQLLITATGRFNVALAANGAVATASSAHTCCGFSTTGAINGNNRGPWGNGEGWNDATPDVVPDWIQVDFAGSKTIDEINVFSLHDNYTQENTPTETQIFTLYGLLSFNVQYWNGSSWTTVPGGSVTGNNKVWRKFSFAPITTSKIRVYINQVPDSWSRVVEIQAFGSSAGGEKVQWLVTDHLGTPRMIADQTGSLAGVRRHDYLPFGEELFAPTGGRTAALGYATVTADGVRQQFTQKERDVETGLDYFGPRYYGNIQGRFLSPDSYAGNTRNPQTFNLYSYVLNNPIAYTDPTGHIPQKCDEACQQRQREVAEARRQAKQDGVDTTTITTNQNKDQPVLEPGQIFQREMEELARMQDRAAHAGDFERMREETQRSMLRHQLSPILYLNPLPRYVQGEIDLPSPAGTTGAVIQFTLDDEGGFWFGSGLYVGTPGGSLSAGWLTPRTAPADYIGGWGGSISATSSKGVGGGLGYASGHFSPSICVGTPGIVGTVTKTNKLGNTRFSWRPKI
jgi:RHS repeat-associated protein